MKMNIKGQEAVIMLGPREAAKLAYWSINPLDDEGTSHQFFGKVRSINHIRMEDEENLKLVLYVGNKAFTYTHLSVMLADDQDVDIILNTEPEISIHTK